MSGETPGFPRFKSAARWDSVEYPDRSCWRIVDDHAAVGRLHLKGVGSVRFRGAERGVRGMPKTLTIRREGDRWRITVFCADVPAEALTPRTAVGDRCRRRPSWSRHPTVNWSATRDISAVRSDRLADRQRLVAGRRRGRGDAASRPPGRALHRKIACQRRDLAHQISRRLVNRYGMIVHEDLQISNMVRRPAPRPNDEGGFDPNGAAAKGGLNREILAAGWGQLLRFITYKAEEAGRDVIAVNPRHTSQTCHQCGHVDPENRHATKFRCTSCGHVDHADINAARNILRAGLAHRHEREADEQVP